MSYFLGVEMKKLVVACVGLCAALASAPARAETPDGWEYITTDDGVVVYRKEVPGSDVVAFKGVAYAKVPIGKILAVFKDPAERPFWVDRYEDHKTLDKSENTETYWIHFGVPWPVSDRDYVLHSDGKEDPEKRVYTCTIKSVERKEAPVNDCCVRAVVYKTFYEFTAVPDGETTKIVVEVHTDPKGSLPSWLVNLIQESWPSNTLHSLIERAKISTRKPLSKFADWHKKASLAQSTVTGEEISSAQE